MVRRFLRRFKVPRDDIDDAAQDVWKDVAKTLAEFKHNGRPRCLRTWFSRVVHSKAVDQIRRRMRHRTESLEQRVESGSQPVDARSGPEAAYERKWVLELVNHCLDELQKESACHDSQLSVAVLRLRLIEARSVSQVAATLDLDPNRVNERFSRQKQKLLDKLKAYTGEDFRIDG